jgi:hypothetical protein
MPLALIDSSGFSTVLLLTTLTVYSAVLTIGQSKFAGLVLVVDRHLEVSAAKPVSAFLMRTGTKT